MKCALVFLLALGASSTDVTPVQKVITLLNGMLEKGKQEKHSEQVQFASYKQFCDDTSVEKTRSIKKAAQAIDMLTADISKYTADSMQLGKEVSGLDKDASVWEGDQKAATAVRQIEKTDYDATHKDYSESVDALQRAILVLKKQSSDRKQKSFAQVAALKKFNLIPAAAKRTIDAFLSEEVTTEEEVQGAPEANAYEFQSHGVIDMLEKLMDKFVDERTTLEKEEQNGRHAFSMLMQDLKAQISQANSDRSQKAQAKSKALQSKADAKGDLQDSSTTKAEDSKFLADLTSECRTKAGDFTSRQELRSQEIIAIEKAIEILGSGSVAGNANKHLPALMQKKTAFPQLRAASISLAQEKASFYLSEQGKHLKSRVLSSVAMHVQEDPFGKVKKMIKDLIVRLMESANEEAEHKGWCDTELSTNQQTRKEKTEATEMLHAEIDELKASIAELSEDITDLTQSVADLDAAMAKATEIRQSEKASNTETVGDSQDAQTAVAQALVVLKEFYAKSAEATALVQTETIQKPSIFDSPYTGMGAESGGVVGMLEVIESDFARLEAETAAAEATAQKTYDSFMTEAKVDKASKSTAGEHKQSKMQNQEQSLTSKASDLDGTQKELDAALSYYDKLKPSCVDSGSSFEDRVSRRKEEIQSLQEALRILNGEETA